MGEIVRLFPLYPTRYLNLELVLLLSPIVIVGADCIRPFLLTLGGRTQSAPTEDRVAHPNSMINTSSKIK